ncbi:hypothetical protein J2Z53_001425 [Clostridium moniliforme]|uniref:Uncharacterized protein n=1 Tax=Clostridium moniliforme TaxID=39489 RepID=A0ABS4F0S6_9CLOT|nr:hypothetical protein [Clostridium moniliforme]MBP1889842.1 hypothetical protein [Clostridium moniliforme]
MGTINTILDKVVPRVQAREGKDKPLIDIIKEELEKEKDLSETDQSKQIDPSKNNLNNILPSGVDLDNGQVFSEETGDTLGEIEEVLK